MVGWRYGHPLYEGVTGPVVHGDHVTTDSGTGLVHTAPAHGVEDFGIGVREGLDLTCPVDGSGKYEDEVPPLSVTGVVLAGQNIWKAQDAIIAELEASGRLLKIQEIVHSYPISWRSKKPLIYRTTSQWFVGMDMPVAGLISEKPQNKVSLRDASLARVYGKGVKGVRWVPEYGMNRIGSMIENRPDWCISRQRFWGVPITIFVNKQTGLPVADPAVWEHIAALVAKEGIDAWDNRIEAGKVEELLPPGWLKAQNLVVSDLEPVRDILDVWFDSGTTHAHVLRADSAPGQRFHRDDGKRPADLYQEGSDQHRGWFHSSLLTSVAAYGDAPYESVVTSGFVVDGQGRKFSKSLGNGVEPRDLLQKYGMDIVRLWVAGSDYSEDIRYSPEIMESSAVTYRKFRNVLRWILGNLGAGAGGRQEACAGGTDGRSAGDARVVPGRPAAAAWPALERYLLHRLGEVMREARAGFDGYQFHRAMQALYEFCERDLSGLYFEARKDVLYCDAADSPRRVAALACLEQVFRALATHLAPLVPFSADEAWRARYGDAACVHLESFAEVDPAWRLDGKEVQAWADLLALRDNVNKAIETAREAGRVGANASARVQVPEVLVEDSGALLSEILAGAQVAVREETAIEAGPAVGEKCPRCWQVYEGLTAGALCERCAAAVKAQG
jgi:isoleucyl-tRNA synthetase